VQPAATSRTSDTVAGARNERNEGDIFAQ
jgi:hypothetical protein